MNPKDKVGSKKAPLGLVPPALEIGASEAMENGATKYGPFNWREQPIEYMSYLVAMKRHIAALIDGQDDAPDTGIHHLKHIVAGGGILLDAMGIEGGLIDNRPPKGPAADMLAALDKSNRQQYWTDTGHAPWVGPSIAIADPVPGTVFWCGHHWGEEPNADCGRLVHWGPVNGIADTRAHREVAAQVPAELAVCEDSGNHAPGLHLLTCPDFGAR